MADVSAKSQRALYVISDNREIKGEGQEGEGVDGRRSRVFHPRGRKRLCIRHYAGRKHLWAMSVPRRVRCPVEASPPRRLKGEGGVEGGGEGERKERNERKGRSRGRLSRFASCLVPVLPYLLPPPVPRPLPY